MAAQELKKPEVLAPAGDWERLEAAVQFGADAVYLGAQQFTMRAGPANFTPEELTAAVQRCHDRGVKVYLTCNTLPREGELAQLEAFFDLAEASGADALIVADLGVFQAARRRLQRTALHVSTQMGVLSSLTARALYDLGASRVVLARELSLEEIAAIRAKTPAQLELEAFVHGALCMSVSGRCLISEYLTGRDANRGDCAQPCRWKYRLVEEKRPGQYFPIGEEEGGGSYLLNARDLCMIDHLAELAAAGVGSFKIEGRAKSAYYVASVTHAYRQGVDYAAAHPGQPLPDWIRQEVEKVSHREYSTGFYFGRPGQCWQSGGYLRRWDVVAVVEESDGCRLTAVVKNAFGPGEPLEVLTPGGPPVPLQAPVLLDEEGQPMDRARHPMQRVQIPCTVRLPAGAMIRRPRPDASAG